MSPLIPSGWMYISHTFTPLSSHPTNTLPFYSIILLVGVDACGVELTSCYYVSIGALAMRATFNCCFISPFTL
jgi:hypothetical protein